MFKIMAVFLSMSLFCSVSFAEPTSKEYLAKKKELAAVLKKRNAMTDKYDPIVADIKKTTRKSTQLKKYQKDLAALNEKGSKLEMQLKKMRGEE